MHHEKRMNFTVKEIYLTLLPGFLILANLFVSMPLFPLSKIETKEATILLFACFILGYVNNTVASVMERDILRVKYHEKGKEELRKLLNALPFDMVIEEYYIHYAQARNMCMAFVLSLFILLIHIEDCKICCFLACKLLVAYIFITGLLYKAYTRHRRRYHALIEQKYNSLESNKQL